MVRIIFMNPPNFMPSEMADSDGFYSLDIKNKERIALTKVIDDYIDIGSIKQDTFKELSIPITKKNRLLIGNIGNPSAFNQDNSKIFPIQLLKGDFSYPVNGLKVVDVSDVDNLFMINIFGEINQWYRPLQNLALNELELGSDVVDDIFIFNTLGDGYIYDPAVAPVYAPLVNYGQWFIQSSKSDLGTPSQAVFENFRLWHSAKALLEQAFCQIGWELVAPMMNEEEFLRHWMYLLDKNFETVNDSNILDRPLELDRSGIFFFEVLFQTIASGKELHGVLPYSGLDVVSDPGSHFLFLPPIPSSTSSFWGGFYSGGIVGNFHAEGEIEIDLTSGSFFIVSPNFITLKVSISKAPRYGNESQQQLLDSSTKLVTKEFIQKGIITSGVPLLFPYSIDTGSVKVYRNEVVFVRIEFLADLADGGGATHSQDFLYDQTTVLSGSTFSCTVEQQVLEQGDTVDFGKILNRDINCLDLFKGIAHLYNWKTQTDGINKKIYCYPESAFDWYISGLQEGFFKKNTDDPVDSVEIIQAGSMKQVFARSELQREVYLKFLNSTDGYIQDKLLDQELYSKKIDLGPQFKDGTNEITNPFFEPLGAGIDLELTGIDISFGPADIRQATNYIPFMWESQSNDGEYPQRGYDFAPRIAIAYPKSQGRVAPELTGYADPAPIAFPYEDQAFLFVLPMLQLGVIGLTLHPTGPPQPPITTDLGIVYGNDENITIADLWHFIYGNSVNQAYFNISLNFLVLIDLITFSNISFRRKWRVKYLSSAWGEIYFFARLSRVTDYSIGDNITTPVELIPDNNNFLNCE